MAQLGQLAQGQFGGGVGGCTDGQGPENFIRVVQGIDAADDSLRVHLGGRRIIKKEEEY